MFLCSDDIRMLIEVCSLIETDLDPSFCEEGNRIEGATYDFRLGKIAIPDPNSDITPFFGFDSDGKEVRRLPKLIELEPTNDVYRLYNGRSYIIQSVETFNMPNGVGGIVASKSSYFVALSETSGTLIHPGFSGKLKCKFRCDFDPYIEVARNYRIGCVKFFRHTPGSCDPYKGIWTGDKLTTDGKFERGY